MWHNQYCVGKRANRHLSHVSAAQTATIAHQFELCIPQDRWEKIKYWMWMMPSPSLSLTAGIQRFPSTIDVIVLGTPTESEEGVFWHTQLTCTRSLPRLNASNYVAMCKTQFWVMLEKCEGLKMKKSYMFMDYMLHDWKALIRGKSLLFVHWKIIYYICKSCTDNIK